MSRSNLKSCFLSLAVTLAITSTGEAAQVFAGRWQSSSGSPISVGIVQHGDTVAIFSETGWSVALVTPETGDMLASGEGRWSFDNSPSLLVNITLGYRNDRLYLQIVPKEEMGSAGYKIIMERVEGELAGPKTSL